jgi:hypothetical protein
MAGLSLTSLPKELILLCLGVDPAELAASMSWHAAVHVPLFVTGRMVNKTLKHIINTAPGPTRDWVYEMEKLARGCSQDDDLFPLLEWINKCDKSNVTKYMPYQWIDRPISRFEEGSSALALLTEPVCDASRIKRALQTYTLSRLRHFLQSMATRWTATPWLSYVLFEITPDLLANGIDVATGSLYPANINVTNISKDFVPRSLDALQQLKTISNSGTSYKTHMRRYFETLETQSEVDEFRESLKDSITPHSPAHPIARMVVAIEDNFNRNWEFDVQPRCCRLLNWLFEACDRRGISWCDRLSITSNTHLRHMFDVCAATFSLGSFTRIAMEFGLLRFTAGVPTMDDTTSLLPSACRNPHGSAVLQFLLQFSTNQVHWTIGNVSSGHMVDSLLDLNKIGALDLSNSHNRYFKTICSFYNLQLPLCQKAIVGIASSKQGIAENLITARRPDLYNFFVTRGTLSPLWHLNLIRHAALSMDVEYCASLCRAFAVPAMYVTAAVVAAENHMLGESHSDDADMKKNTQHFIARLRKRLLPVLVERFREDTTPKVTPDAT